MRRFEDRLIDQSFDDWRQYEMDMILLGNSVWLEDAEGAFTRVDPKEWPKYETLLNES